VGWDATVLGGTERMYKRSKTVQLQHSMSMLSDLERTVHDDCDGRAGDLVDVAGLVAALNGTLMKFDHVIGKILATKPPGKRRLVIMIWPLVATPWKTAFGTPHPCRRHLCEGSEYCPTPPSGDEPSLAPGLHLRA
jgi:hypothetical protein